jgi:hypothetical protein
MKTLPGIDSKESLAIVCQRLQAYQRFRNPDETHITPICVPLPEPAVHPLRPTLLVASVALAALTAFLSIVLWTGDPFAGARRQENQTKEFWRHYLQASAMGAPVKAWIQTRQGPRSVVVDNRYDIPWDAGHIEVLFKGWKHAVEDLPQRGNALGDMWALEATNHCWVWTTAPDAITPSWIDP